MNLGSYNRLGMLAIVGALCIALAGCDAGEASPQPSTSPSMVDARVAWLALANCMRTNGSPNFPDPVQNQDGVWNIPPGVNDPVPAACDQLFRTAKQATNVNSGPSAEEMAQLRQYAACLREHGLSQFPDPDADGNYGPLGDLQYDPAYRPAQEACRQYAPPVRPK